AGEESRKKTGPEKSGCEEKSAEEESGAEKRCPQEGRPPPLAVHAISQNDGGSPALFAGFRRHSPYFPSDTIASASISSSISGETRAVIAIMVLAGRMSRENSPWAFPTFSQSAMLVRNTRVRTTSFSEAPARSSARSMFLRV